MLRKQSLYMLSMHEPISAIMAALAEKLHMETQINPLAAQEFAAVYAQFSHVPMLTEIVNDIMRNESVEQSLQPKMIDPSRHLISIGFARRHAEFVVARVAKLTMMIISGGVPADVIRRPDNHWTLIEPNELWVYTYEPKDATAIDS